MNALKIVYWDVDGTIADTEMYGHRIAFNKSFEESGLDWTWDTNTYRDLLEVSGGFNRIKFYLNQIDYTLSDNQILKLHSDKQNHYSKIISSGEIPLRKGVARLIDELYSNSIKQWIVTTSSRVAVDSLLHSVLKDRNYMFDGFTTFEDVTRTKPDPQAYNEACYQSMISRNNSIVIEDSLIGLKSAIAAGLNCLVTYPPWTNINSEDYENANAVVDTLGDKDSECHISHGPVSKERLINLEYLTKLIN